MCNKCNILKIRFWGTKDFQFKSNWDHFEYVYDTLWLCKYLLMLQWYNITNKHMVTAYYVVQCLNIKMNILTHGDKIYIYNLGEFITGGATWPPIMDLQLSFFTQNKYS